MTPSWVINIRHIRVVTSPGSDWSPDIPELWRRPTLIGHPIYPSCDVIRLWLVTRYNRVVTSPDSDWLSDIPKFLRHPAVIGLISTSVSLNSYFHRAKLRFQSDLLFYCCVMLAVNDSLINKKCENIFLYYCTINWVL